MVLSIAVILVFQKQVYCFSKHLQSFVCHCHQLPSKFLSCGFFSGFNLGKIFLFCFNMKSFCKLNSVVAVKLLKQLRSCLFPLMSSAKPYLAASVLWIFILIIRCQVRIISFNLNSLNGFREIILMNVLLHFDATLRNKSITRKQQPTAKLFLELVCATAYYIINGVGMSLFWAWMFLFLFLFCKDKLTWGLHSWYIPVT